MKVDIRLLGSPQSLWRQVLDTSIAWQEIEEFFEAEICRVTPQLESPEEWQRQMAEMALQGIAVVRNQALNIRYHVIWMAEGEDEDEDEPRPDLERTLRPDEKERVCEFHGLRKLGFGINTARRAARCDSRTYRKWCLKVTGEDPI